MEAQQKNDRTSTRSASHTRMDAGNLLDCSLRRSTSSHSQETIEHTHRSTSRLSVLGAAAIHCSIRGTPLPPYLSRVRETCRDLDAFTAQMPTVGRYLRYLPTLPTSPLFPLQKVLRPSRLSPTAPELSISVTVHSSHLPCPMLVTLTVPSRPGTCDPFKPALLPVGWVYG